ncbi:ABC transporter ATP-binding protein [Cryobacterium melibiosiphilum]|uniref:ABC-type quaternary amine transporter n=1 Tax=Cryobacterium melibiosiphilum TaxID=995039 RepID=A0A3A5MK25_9MICO|nr:ABC transporter ATP-binding protein [Cryobacterium melibiosiphilum]RJT89742.1 ABC transporter ATP-binding protein [Cryobacterium melibiosiphilum]
MTTTSAEVTLRSIQKSFGRQTVLNDVDLTIRGGELLAVLGPSGCGKTTALRVIAGLERPDHGTVHIDNDDVTHRRIDKRGIGIVFQAYSLFPHQTAAENVAYGLRVRGTGRSSREARAAELLAMVGLADHGSKYPQQLSGGQQQRVALARAIAIEPRVLLLDEPLSALDAQVRVQLRDEIRRIQYEMGTTTVLVTHDQEEALSMADRVAVMRAGQVEQVGTPHEVYRRPATAFVSSFIGVVNRLSGRVVGGDRVLVLGQGLTLSTAGHSVGHVIAVLVRPEHLAIQRADASAADAATGVVTALTLRGAISSLTVLLPELPDTIRVDLPSREAQDFTRGDRVRVIVHAEDALIDASAVPSAAVRAGERAAA